MAVTETVLNAFNVFSSTSVFNANKNSLQSNDINFVKHSSSETSQLYGGIITQSLGATGYIKFANGVIFQWGPFVHGTNYFPIAFPNAVFSVTAAGECQWGNADVTLIKDPTTTTFSTEKEASMTACTYMALGN
jgi:hypothetical protein